MKDHGKGTREVPLETSTGASSPPRVPRAFDLGPGTAENANSPHTARKRLKVEIEESIEPDAIDGVGVTLPAAQRTPGFLSLSALFWAAVSLLVTVYLADSAWTLFLSLDAKSPWVGQIVLGLIGVVVFGVMVFVAREVFAMLRMRKVLAFRQRAKTLIETPDARAARDFVAELRDFYTRDAASAAGRAEVSRELNELHDPKTLLAIAERALIKAKDDAARHAISVAAQRVSMITALSPRAIIDVLFVLVQSIGLIRRLSTIYGGRAGGVGLLRLAAQVVSHLAVTGGMAVADSMVGQFLGAGIAARLSAKLGEGVLNGILTARVGIAAIDLCRPVPFVECEPVRLSEVVKNIVTQSKVAENPAA